MVGHLTKKLLVSVGSLLVAALLAESGFRTWRAVQGQPHDSGALAEEMRRLVDPTRAFAPLGADEQRTPPRPEAAHEVRKPVLHPFAASEVVHDSGGVLAAFHAGFDPDEYTIVVVGGSVAAAWASSGGAQANELLRADPRFAGKRIRLLNYAHAAFKQPQQSTRLAYLFALGHMPDAVINLDGFNEVALTLGNRFDGTHPVYPSAPVWGALVRNLEVVDQEQLESSGRSWMLRKEAERVTQRALRWKLHHSSILGPMAVQSLRRIQAERFAVSPIERGAKRRSDGAAQVDRQRTGPDHDSSGPAMLEAGARSWVEGSRSLQAMCAMRGVRYFHVLQPTLLDNNSKVMSREELELGKVPLGWLRGASEGYPMLRERSVELLARGIRFHDASRMFEGVADTLYYDHCHLNPLGNRRMGAEIWRAFLEPAPVDLAAKEH